MERYGALRTDGTEERLPRVIGLGSATAVVVGTMISSGIFSVPAVVAANVTAPGLAILCWIVGGLITLCGALSVAELATALPRSGGPFAYLLEAYGPLPAFLLGWAALTIIMGAVLAAMATIFADYLAVLVPLTPGELHEVAALLIVVAGAVNYTGVRGAAAVMRVTSAAKLMALVALGALAFTASGGRVQHPAGHALSGVSLSSFVAALVPIMWTYDGWQDLACIGGEVMQPQRTLPLALGLGTGCVAAVYLLVNLGFYHLLSSPTIAHSQLVAATVAARIPALAGVGAAAVAGVVLVSIFSGITGVMMAGSRVLYAMADRGLFFAPLGYVSRRFRTPSVAICLATVLGCANVLGSDFAQLANRLVLGGWPFFMLTVAAVFVLRRTRPDLPRPYRTWGYPIVPAVFLVATLGVFGFSLATNLREMTREFLIILCGVPAYYLWRSFAGRNAARWPATST